MSPFIPSLLVSIVFHEYAGWDIHGDVSEMLLEWKTCFQSDTHAKRTKKCHFQVSVTMSRFSLGNRSVKDLHGED